MVCGCGDVFSVSDHLIPVVKNLKEGIVGVVTLFKYATRFSCDTLRGTLSFFNSIVYNAK